MRYVLLVSYDGTAYGGWQIQKNSVTVQQMAEEAASSLFGVKTAVTASGRTDAGVHAEGQVCHLDGREGIPPSKLADALNARLPADICVLASAAAPEGFDAVRSAKRKTYRYSMYFSPRRLPLKDRFSLWVKAPADLEKLARCARLFEGEHDFAAYSKSGSSAKTTVRTVYSVRVEERDGEAAVRVTGNGFLYNMVRTIAGTMLGYAQGSVTEERIILSLGRGDRSLAGKTLPPCGLTLESVDYGFPLFGAK